MALQHLHGKPSLKNSINPPRVMGKAEEFTNATDTIKAFMEQVEKMAENSDKIRTLADRDTMGRVYRRTEERLNCFKRGRDQPLSNL
jgi:hypothetical protein